METNSEGDHVDSYYGLCLICHSKISLSNTTTTTGQDYFDHPLNPKLLLKDLQTYFLLKHILGISSEQIQGYLRHCPYPGDWVKVCSLCTETYVNSCTRTFLELQEARRKYRVAREQLIEAVKKSVENETESQEPFTLDICREVRKSVAHGKYDLVENRMNKSLLAPGKIVQRPYHHFLNGACAEPDSHLNVTDASCVKVEVTEENCELDEETNGTNVVHRAKQNWDDNQLNEGDVRDEFSESSDDKYVPEVDVHVSSTFKRNGSNFEVKRNDNVCSTASSGDDIMNLSELTCHVCSKIFANSSKLRKHIKECHEGVYHHCPEEGCNWKSRRFYDVTLHRKRRHGTVEDFLALTCPVCSKIFDKKPRLRTHMIRRHNETAPTIVCKKCGNKKFIDESGLKSHLAVVHNMKKYQIHVCRYKNCGRGFYRLCDFQCHQRNHQELKCGTCEKVLKTVRGLKIHMFAHKLNVVIPFQCTLCPMLRFSKRVDLIRHKKLRHPVSTKDRGQVKIMEISESVNEEHVARSSESDDLDYNCDDVQKGVDDKLTCDICGRVCKSPKRLENHKESHVKDHATTSSIQCTFCPVSLINRIDLLSHLKLWHSPLNSTEERTNVVMAERENKARANKDNNANTKADDVGKQKSDLHDGGFKLEDFVSARIATGSKVKTKCRKKSTKKRKDGFPTDEENGKVQDETTHEKELKRLSRNIKIADPVTCELCGNGFKTKTNLKTHMVRTHTKKFQYYCELCGFGAINPSYLQCHKVKAHFICAVEDCGVTCADLQGVWKHHKDVHNTQLGVFGCDDCGKVMVNKRKWRNHLHLHEIKRQKQERSSEDGVVGVVGYYEFVCDLCGLQFPVKDYLRTHMRTHHGIYQNKKAPPPATNQIKSEDNRDQ